MRLANIETKNGPSLCVKGKSGYTDISTAVKTDKPIEIKSLFTDNRLLAAAVELSAEEGITYSENSFRPIVSKPGRILCLGLNYKAHADQMGKGAALVWPEVFLRHAGTVIGSHEYLIKPYFSRQFQFEGELGIVVGKGGHFIKAKDAPDSIAGFVALNDATAREWQRAASQWTCGKNFDATFPIGSEMLTVDETDPMKLTVRTTVNGRIVQDSNTSEMILNAWRAVEFLSGICHLRPGDIIATGTPAIVEGTPEEFLFLKNGDRVSVSIQNIGEVINEVREESDGPNDWPWMP